MDAKGFRISKFPQPPSYLVKQETMREIDAAKTTPAPDSRFSAYAAPLSDGRLVTDYRQSCVGRAPPGSQFAVKSWSIHNADTIMEISRLRQVQNTGQALGTANTELPPEAIQTCTPESCKIQYSGYSDGIGIERTDKAPPLFGTFTFPPSYATLAKNKNHTELNKTIEYGRNTPTRWGHLYQ